MQDLSRLTEAGHGVSAMLAMLTNRLACVFIAAMIALCSGLVSFLREISVATRRLRIGGP